MKTTHKVTTTFDDSVSYMSGTTKEVKDEIRTDCRKNGRNVNDYNIIKI